MTAISRRAVLGTVAAAASTVPALIVGDLVPEASASASTVATDTYPSNTALYSDPALEEGTDYARRYHRQAMLDDSLDQRYGFTKTAVIAPHGGGIEAGTSELCLAIAGYHPAHLSVTPAGGPTYDYWMFEGLRSSGNAQLHVTATHCDDTVAMSLCAGALNVLALHGCGTNQAGLPDGSRAVLVGGLDGVFKQHLLDEYVRAGFWAIDAINHESLNGNSPDNIANRTLRRQGAQLEMTTPLRTAMFEQNSRLGRPESTTDVFWAFVAATRTAIARVEAGQTIL